MHNAPTPQAHPHTPGLSPTARSHRRAGALGALLLLASWMVARAGVAAPRGQAHPQLWPPAHSVGLLDPATEALVSELMGRMSLEEKVGQIIQADIASITPQDLRRYPLGAILAGGNSPPLGGDDRAPAQAWIDTARAFRAVSIETRPGHTPIPILFGIDAVHGNNNVVGATLFPHNIGLGAAHDAALIRRIGAATAQESVAVGIDWTFGPTLAVPQDVRWGRSYEGYSEDPLLVRSYARAMVLGLQGEPNGAQGVHNAHVAASAKHFLGDGGTTGGVDQGDTDVNEQALIRTHAQGYLSAIDAGVMTVMVSYSSWQGRKMHGNESLLTGVLKQRLGFEGFVVSDWNGHGQLEGCSGKNCPAAFKAGIDMFMAPDGWRELFDNTLTQVRTGEIALARLDDAVRRILRVKVKLGLFEPDRPWEGRLDVLGSLEHRALARLAVRKSLVLLKNDGRVLPLRASAHVLIAGEGADDIGRQCGGWTLSWQGTGNTNLDFPHGESIYAGLRSALEAGGGSAELSVEGAYTRRPDAAIVVFGESPYAEYAGDVRSLEFQAGDKHTLVLLRRLRAAHIPVVSVLLSGRPLWVNPEINASDAFVAAWLPGSEGGGIADVLIGDARGGPRYDFSGTLSFAWPNRAIPSQAVPLYALGYGLRYADHARAPHLSERSGLAAAASDVESFLVNGVARAPWGWVLRAGGDTLRPNSSSAALAGNALAMQAVDAGGVQEGGRRFMWGGRDEASVALAGATLDLAREARGAASLLIEYRVDVPPTAPVVLSMGCRVGCDNASGVDLSAELAAAPPGEWRRLSVKLSSFAAAGVDLSQVNEPFVLRTRGAAALTLRGVRLGMDPAGAGVLPGVAQ